MDKVDLSVVYIVKRLTTGLKRSDQKKQEAIDQSWKNRCNPERKGNRRQRGVMMIEMDYAAMIQWLPDSKARTMVELFCGYEEFVKKQFVGQCIAYLRRIFHKLCWVLGLTAMTEGFTMLLTTS